MDLQESAPMVPEALLDMRGKASIWTERRPDVESPLAAKLSGFPFTCREPVVVVAVGAARAARLSNDGDPCKQGQTQTQNAHRHGSHPP